MGTACTHQDLDESSTEVGATRPPTCTVAVLCADDDVDRYDRDDRGFVVLNEVPVDELAATYTNRSLLRRPLLENEPIELPSSPVSRRLSRKESIHGKRANASASDLDICFQFVLPGRAKRIAARAELEKRPKVAAVLWELAEVDRKRMIQENVAFNAYLESKAKRQGEGNRHVVDHEPYQPFVEKLFKDFFVEDEVGEKFRCPHIGSLADARKLCIDLLVTFLRREAEPYYSYMFSTLDHEELLLCVKMDADFCDIHADVSEYILQLDSTSLDSDKLNIALSHRFEGEDGAAMQPAHAVFRRGAKHLFRVHEEADNPKLKSVFRKKDSIRLLYDRLTDVFNIEAMKECGLLVDYFPLHSQRSLKQLRDKWARVGRWYRYDQPVEDIRVYFGENIAMYFIFVEFVCRWTRWLAAAGVLLIGVDVWVEHLDKTGNLASNPCVTLDKTGILRLLGAKCGVPLARVGFVFFTIMWTILFRLYLQRKAWRCYNLWGMDCDFNTSQIKAESNPRFANMAHMVKSDVDDNIVELGVTPQAMRRGQALSLMGSILFVAAAFASVLSLMNLQAQFAAEGRHDLIGQAMPYAVIIPIKFFNFLSGYISPVLTDYEHHRDQLDYENSIAVKKFYLQLINTFCTFYYIAFLMRPWGDTSYDTYGGAWEYLTYEMLVTFLLYLVFVVFDIVTPMVNLWIAIGKDVKRVKKLGHDCDELPFLELQRRMDTYTGELRNEDHLQIILPLGFVILFGATLPLGACLALCVFGLQLRVDALKLTTAMRRPFPASVVPGQWIWLNLINTLMWVSVVTNIGLVCFTMKPFADKDFADKAVLFFTIVTVVLFIDLILSRLIPEIPREVVLAQQRHRHQRHAYTTFATEKKTQTMTGKSYLNDVLVKLPQCMINYEEIPGCEIDDEEQAFGIPGVKLRHSKSLAQV